MILNISPRTVLEGLTLLGLDPIKIMFPILKNSGVIIYPTETVYGLGGKATSNQVIERIYRIKGRDKSKPLIILVRDFVMARGLAKIEPFEGLLKGYWPGALTGIFVAKNNLPSGIVSGEGKIAVRISSHPFVKSLFKMINFPLISTSANRSGEPNCLTIEAAKKSLGEKFSLVDYSVDFGELPDVPPSTLVDFTVHPAKILRQGSVVFEPLETSG